METPDYKPLIDRVVDGLKSRFDDQFKAIFWGDPIEIGMSSYPAICVLPGKTRVTPGPTGMDRVTREIIVEVIFSKYEDFGASPTMDLTERKLDNYMLARATDGTWDTSTILHFLRTEITLSGGTVKQDIEIQPMTGLGRFKNDKGEPQSTSEVHMTITVEELVPVNNRT